MSHQCLADAFAPWEADYKEQVMQNVWGHLAPKKNVTYRGRIVYAVGCFGSDPLNPTSLLCNLTAGDEELSSSPWFYEALNDFLRGLENEEGCVYELQGTFRNYRFRFRRRVVYDANKG